MARRGRRKTGTFWSLRYKPAKLAPATATALANCADDSRDVCNPRFAVSVSKRHLRRANRRNRLRRVLRESFRQVWAGELAACDYLLASASAFAKSNEEELRGECLRLLKEASDNAARKTGKVGKTRNHNCNR